MKIVLFAGGTGSSKLIRGVSSLLRDFTVIANVGDNVWMHGLYVCPDLDTAMYTLAGVLDLTKSWGVSNDTFSALDQFRRFGEQSWFKLGDRDLATHIFRTQMLRRGFRLSQVTAMLTKRFGIRPRLLPPTDDHIETRVVTPSGELHLQEFWVRDRGRHRVTEVRYKGVEIAKATQEALSAISEADRIIFCPANPVTSILPILSTPGIREAIVRAQAVKISLSPFQGDRPFSGPAAKFMKCLGMPATSVSLAQLYRGVVDKIVIDSEDERMKNSVEKLGVQCGVAPTFMTDVTSERRVARLLLEA